MRLVLALVVVVSHAPLIMGIGEPYHLGDLEVGGWAVAAFFSISGWLISGSRMRLDLVVFMWRRCLRLFPAFWIALATTAFVFAPISALRGDNVFSVGSAAPYISKNITLWIFEPRIAGTLEMSPTTIWNLSLWTLSWEMICYLGVGLLLGWNFARRGPTAIVCAFVLATLANLAIRTTEIVPPSSALGAGSRLGSFFLAGAVLYVCAGRVRLDFRLAALCICVLAGLIATQLVGALGALPIAYLSMYAGVRLPFDRVGRRNDISYGIYIYGYPVGQLLVVFGMGGLSVGLFILVNSVLVIALAWVSWLAIERPAMRWKRLLSSSSRAKTAIASESRPPA